MNKTSILLALDGSDQAYQAARLAFHLAETGGAKITAQHVVDTKTAWGLLGTHKAGFIGSGLYVAAYENLCSSLYDLANHLAESYEALASGSRIAGQCLIDEGNPFEIILQRLNVHDLLVIGHEATASRYPRSQNLPFTRASLAGALANASAKPILIVQKNFKIGKAIKFFCSSSDVDRQLVKSYCKLAGTLGLQPELAVLNPQSDQMNSELESKIKEACADVDDMPVEILDVSIDNKDVELWSKKPIEIDLQAMAESLLVVPTKVVDGKRITIFGSSPGAFLRHLTLSQVMLFPQNIGVVAAEEQTVNQFAYNAEK